MLVFPSRCGVIISCNSSDFLHYTLTSQQLDIHKLNRPVMVVYPHHVYAVYQQVNMKILFAYMEKELIQYIIFMTAVYFHWVVVFKAHVSYTCLNAV